MTAIEHKELRGITIKNLVVTITGTASIVASVMTTYFGLKSDIQQISVAQKTEERVNNVRIKALEDEVVILQRQVDDLKFNNVYRPNHKQPAKPTYPSLLTAASIHSLR